MRTLVADDDTATREGLEAGLRELGHEVTAVADGNAGLIAHLREPYDLLVIDWVMPGLDGVQLTQRIRSIPGGDQPYILVCTGRDRPEDLAKVIDAGADDYLAKPVDLGLLHTRVRIAERRLASNARHRQAREALARSEVDFRRVIERCPLGIIAFCDGEVVYVNNSAARALGHDRDAIVGRPMLDLVPDRHREATARRMYRFERTDVPPPAIESEFLRADGTALSAWVIPMTRALFDGSRASFLMFEDITERKAAERELRLTQFAIDHAADLALWFNRDGRICYANHAACATLGWPREALLGRGARDIDAAPRPAGVADWAAIAQGGSRKVESVFRTRQGETFPVEISTNALAFHGETYVIAFARDLTERKRLQASLQKADRLASVGSLAAGVAHEINNPLAYVIANLELITEELQRSGGVPEGDVGRGVLRTLADALEGAQRVRRIVGDLKSFARADEEEASAVEIHEVIDAAIDIAANEIRHRAVLERRYGAEVPAVRGNAGRLTQVFLNLLVNAAHAIPESQSDRHRITVRTRAQGESVMIEIADTGGGIPSDIVDRIFDPFFTTKPQGMGTGLGLSICHGIVTALGGEIRVDTSLGQGSTFRVVLPRAESPPVRPLLEPIHADQHPARPLSILVVDDEPLIGEGIRRALAGHRVEVARGGREAIERCQATDFDLVLCDVMMPDVSGMEVYGRIRAAKPDLEARFVFMTGGAFTPKAREFLESVDAERIEKPFSLRDLRTLVNRRAEAS